jgi:hypothetical protein
LAKLGEVNEGCGFENLIEDLCIHGGVYQVTGYLQFISNDPEVQGGNIYLLTTSKGHTSGEGNKVPTSVLQVLFGAADSMLCSLHYSSRLFVSSLPIQIIQVTAKCRNNLSLFVSNQARYPALCEQTKVRG